MFHELLTNLSNISKVIASVAGIEIGKPGSKPELGNCDILYATSNEKSWMEMFFLQLEVLSEVDWIFSFSKSTSLGKRKPCVQTSCTPLEKLTLCHILLVLDPNTPGFSLCSL